LWCGVRESTDQRSGERGSSKAKTRLKEATGVVGGLCFKRGQKVERGRDSTGRWVHRKRSFEQKRRQRKLIITAVGGIRVLRGSGRQTYFRVKGDKGQFKGDGRKKGFFQKKKKKKKRESGDGHFLREGEPTFRKKAERRYRSRNPGRRRKGRITMWRVPRRISTTKRWEK